MVTASPWTPHGKALLDYLGGDRDATVWVHSATGEPRLESVDAFFRSRDDFEPWERAALDRCRGRVLDVGAGAGPHALELQRRGLNVTALDACPECVEVMRRRGVTDARLATTSDVDDGPYDTLLFLMHGIGIVGDLDGLRWALADAHRLLAPGGLILLDSRDPFAGPDSPPVEHPDGYAGSCELWMSYRDWEGPPFWWLYVDIPTLQSEAAAVGWNTDVLMEGAGGHYLAALTATPPSQDRV